MTDDLRTQLQTTLGDGYTLVPELGGGGMSRVFVARENALGRDVVVKVLSPDHVVFCTGYELPKALPLDGHSIKSTWAIATHPVSSLPTWLTSTVVREASDPYLSLRTTVDGRIIAGGENEASAPHIPTGVV